MNQEEKERIKIKIEKLKDEKENLKFGHSAYSNTWIAILVFLATMTITITGEFKGLEMKSISIIIFAGLIFVCNKGFTYAIKERVKSLEKKAKEIEKLYERLLK